MDIMDIIDDGGFGAQIPLKLLLILNDSDSRCCLRSWVNIQLQFGPTEKFQANLHYAVKAGQFCLHMHFTLPLYYDSYHPTSQSASSTSSTGRTCAFNLDCVILHPAASEVTPF